MLLIFFQLNHKKSYYKNGKSVFIAKIVTLLLNKSPKNILNDNYLIPLNRYELHAHHI